MADRLDLLRQTLEGIITYCTPPYELIVVDNGSSQEVLDYLIKFQIEILKKSSGVQAGTIFNKENAGGARAFNQGFKQF